MRPWTVLRPFPKVLVHERRCGVPSPGAGAASNPPLLPLVPLLPLLPLVPLLPLLLMEASNGATASPAVPGAE